MGTYSTAHIAYGFVVPDKFYELHEGNIADNWDDDPDAYVQTFLEDTPFELAWSGDMTRDGDLTTIVVAKNDQYEGYEGSVIPIDFTDLSAKVSVGEYMGLISNMGLSADDVDPGWLLYCDRG